MPHDDSKVSGYNDRASDYKGPPPGRGCIAGEVAVNDVGDFSKSRDAKKCKSDPRARCDCGPGKPPCPTALKWQCNSYYAPNCDDHDEEVNGVRVRVINTVTRKSVDLKIVGSCP